MLKNLAQFLGQRQLKILIFSVVTIVAFLYTSHFASAQSTLNDQSKVTINGIGPVRVGMTLQEAVNSTNIPFTLKVGAGVGSQCGFANPATGPKGLEFMVTEGRIARIDILSNQKIMTLGGAKIGDSEARIKALYPKQLTITPHKYVPQGHYLTFVPKDDMDKQYRLIFETEGQKVTRFRVGQRPEVEFVEGCA